MGSKSSLRGGTHAACRPYQERRAREPEELKLRIREGCNEPSIDINKIIRHRRFKWLGQILRLEKDKEKTRLLKLAVTQMKKPYPAGSILMDAPEHSSMDQLIDYAHDVDRWAIWANAILDPNHA